MQYGNLTGNSLINGTEQVVFDSEVTGSAVTSIATGNILNGDEDGWYTIIVRHIGTAATSGISARLNNDSGTNYGYRATTAKSTAVADENASSQTALYLLGESTLNGYTGFSVSRVYAKSGAVRLVHTSTADLVTGATVGSKYEIGQVWSNTADNITNITFLSATNGIGVGSRIIILKSNNFTNGTPTGVINTPYIQGSWVRVGNESVAVATNKVDFTVDGDRDEVYMISAYINNVTSAANCGLRFNDDAGNNYGFQSLGANNTTISAQRTTVANWCLGILNDTNQKGMVQFLVFAKSGFLRPVLMSRNNGIVTTTISDIGMAGDSWSNTADNITKISFVNATNSNAVIGAGSIIDVYALRPNG